MDRKRSLSKTMNAVERGRDQKFFEYKVTFQKADTLKEYKKENYHGRQREFDFLPNRCRDR